AFERVDDERETEARSAVRRHQVRRLEAAPERGAQQPGRAGTEREREFRAQARARVLVVVVARRQAEFPTLGWRDEPFAVDRAVVAARALGRRGFALAEHESGPGCGIGAEREFVATQVEAERMAEFEPAEQRRVEREREFDAVRARTCVAAGAVDRVLEAARITGRGRERIE